MNVQFFVNRITTLAYGGYVEVALKKSNEPLLRTLRQRMDLVAERSQMVRLMLGGRHGMVAGQSYGHSILLFSYKVRNRLLYDTLCWKLSNISILSMKRIYIRNNVYKITF